VRGALRLAREEFSTVQHLPSLHLRGVMPSQCAWLHRPVSCPKPIPHRRPFHRDTFQSSASSEAASQLSKHAAIPRKRGLAVQLEEFDARSYKSIFKFSTGASDRSGAVHAAQSVVLCCRWVAAKVKRSYLRPPAFLQGQRDILRPRFFPCNGFLFGEHAKTTVKYVAVMSPAVNQRNPFNLYAGSIHIRDNIWVERAALKVSPDTKMTRLVYMNRHSAPSHYSIGLLRSAPPVPPKRGRRSSSPCAT